jgi:hypothetical protein
VTGYTTTAIYTGTLAKLTQGRTIYTAYFEGEEIRTPLEMTEPKPLETALAKPPATPPEAAAVNYASTALTAAPVPEASPKGENEVLLLIIPFLGALSGGTYYFINKKKKEKKYEKTTNPTHNPDLDVGAHNPGFGI